MNNVNHTGLFERFLYRAMLATRYLGPKPICYSISVDQKQNTIGRIYVINLDRKDERWNRIKKELTRVNDASGEPLTALTRRFSAIDARYYDGLPDSKELVPHYSLADQLFVDPNPRLVDGLVDVDQRVDMTRQEVAVALSHIAVWRLVASSEVPYTLVLEDDIYFRRGFAQYLDAVWAELMQTQARTTNFGVLYLSYRQVSAGATIKPVSKHLFEPLRGLWQLSGYILSKRGAERLLDLLPVQGPVDLWMNYQFSAAKVFASQTPIIEQRLDDTSSNEYSILPTLSNLGVLTNEKILSPNTRTLPRPIFAFGSKNSGLTSLAMALSMLGYRCCSDIAELPSEERDNLFGKKRKRSFDAYVNVGSFSFDDYLKLATIYPHARFIMTSEAKPELRVTTEGNLGTVLPEEQGLSKGTLNVTEAQEFVKVNRSIRSKILEFPRWHEDKWDSLSRFLDLKYPNNPYPESQDTGQRKMSLDNTQVGSPLSHVKMLKNDKLPWIAPSKSWKGIHLVEIGDSATKRTTEFQASSWTNRSDGEPWVLRNDTFPSNLALFKPGNFSIVGEVAQLVLRQEQTSVREFTSASICSQEYYRYGRFVADIKPANIPGLITGIFLHRNSPRQEIDIEFLGKDTTKMLVNVYYNPGLEGTKLEYGYRGTPTLIDLGFDASNDFHLYEIEWNSTAIRWLVDGQLVYKRVNWNPTPIPHLPMNFNVNLWHSRSEELAGRLPVDVLPACAELRYLEVFGYV